MKRLELIHGDHFVVCDRTGFRVLASMTRKEWTGAIVWERVFEARHPQDMLRGIKDQQNVEFARPKAEPRYLTDNQVTRDSL